MMISLILGLSASVLDRARILGIPDIEIKMMIFNCAIGDAYSYARASPGLDAAPDRLRPFSLETCHAPDPACPCLARRSGLCQPGQGLHAVLERALQAAL